MLMEREVLRLIQEVEGKAILPVPQLDVPHFAVEESAEILKNIEKMMGRLMYTDED